MTGFELAKERGLIGESVSPAGFYRDVPSSSQWEICAQLIAIEATLRTGLRQLIDLEEKRLTLQREQTKFSQENLELNRQAAAESAEKAKQLSGMFSSFMPPGLVPPAPSPSSPAPLTPPRSPRGRHGR